MAQQENILRLSMIQQEAEKLEEKMQIIEQQISEMLAIKTCLEEIKTKNGEGEMLSNLGKGIFIKTELKDKNLFVNAGKGVVLKKSCPDCIELVSEQTEKLFVGKNEAMSRIESLQEEMQEIMHEIEGENSGNKKEKRNEKR